MFPALFETSNKTYKATLKKPLACEQAFSRNKQRACSQVKKPFTNIILGSGYNMFLAKNQAI